MEGAAKVSARTRFRWVVFAFVPSSLMLGITTALTTDVPPIPLLWVVPLALYLLSFVLVFARNPPLPHAWLSRRTPILILAAAIPVVLKGALPLIVSLAVDALALFVVALVCHGEIARTRPATQHLTQFYFLVALGGVLGGAFNALVAPAIFSTVLELPIVLVLAAVLCPPAAATNETPSARKLDYVLPLALGLVVAAAILEMQSRGVAPGRLFNLLVFGPAAIVLCALDRVPGVLGWELPP